MRAIPGTCFVVPFGKNAWGLGLVARIGKTGIAYEYFFNRIFHEQPGLAECVGLTPADAAFAEQIGDSALREHRWPILGILPNWDPAEWPMPDFAMRQMPKFPTRVQRSDVDPNKTVKRTRSSLRELEGLPDDYLTGAYMPEHRFQKLFGHPHDFVPTTATSPSEPAMNAQSPYAVIARFTYKTDSDEDALGAAKEALWDALEDALDAAGTGSLDGDLLGDGELLIYIDGDNPAAILTTIRPLLGTHPLVTPDQATLSPGDGIGPAVTIHF